jgi:hypothetical protein
MELAFSGEATNHLDTQGFTNNLWKPRDHCCLQNHLPLLRILNEINAVLITLYCFTMIHFNIILPVGIPNGGQVITMKFLFYVTSQITKMIRVERLRWWGQLLRKPEQKPHLCLDRTVLSVGRVRTKEILRRWAVEIEGERHRTGTNGEQT